MSSKHCFKIEDKRDFNDINRIIISIVIFLILCISFSVGCFASVPKQYSIFSENGNTNYKVYLAQNEFYNSEYEEENNQYITELISKINANFKYNISSEKQNDYNVTYRIDATVSMKDTTSKKLIYKHVDKLVDEKQAVVQNRKAEINENLDIDYAYFNDIAQRFITRYKLEHNSENMLEVTMFVKAGDMEESEVTLSIPLTKQTVAISTSSDFASSKESTKSEKIEASGMFKFLLVCALITGIFVIYNLYKLVQYFIDTRSPKEKYRSEKRKILSSYGDYINKTVDYSLDLNNYEIIKLGKFTELLKIKEDLSRPILMIENEDRTNTMFAITDNEKFVYIYVLGITYPTLTAGTKQEDKV